MSIKFTKLTKTIVMATAVSLFSASVKAEPVSLDEAFEEAFYKNGENTFKQSGFLGQINTILGIPKYPEQDILADGKAVDDVYQIGLELQNSTGERMVTRDLENPYSTSLRENPGCIAISTQNICSQ